MSITMPTANITMTTANVTMTIANITRTTTPEAHLIGLDGLPIVPVFGLPGLDFYYIHVSAVISLSISLIASVGVIFYMMKGGQNLYKLPVGERLVMYLAVCDFGYSLRHNIEHAYFLGALDHPPDATCIAMAYFMLTFYAASGFIVVFTAINALVMVVFMRKLVTGKYDWILLSATFGTSAMLMMVAAIFGFLGPTGAWCEFDVRKLRGRIGSQLISICTLLVFAIDFVCYATVLIKIRQSVGKTTANGGGNTKYHRSARLMIIFVVAYFVQNWPAMIYYIWAYITDPPLALVILLVVLVNMGGLFNAVAYTVIRKFYQSAGRSQSQELSQTENSTARSTSKVSVSQSEKF